MPFPNHKALEFDDLQNQVDPGVLRTEMESGFSKQARLYSQPVFIRSFTYVFTAVQYDAFRTWWKDDIGLGSGWFDWIDPVDGVTKNVMMINGLFSALPVNLGDGSEPDWRVNFQLEVRDI